MLGTGVRETDAQSHLITSEYYTLCVAKAVAELHMRTIQLEINVLEVGCKDVKLDPMSRTVAAVHHTSVLPGHGHAHSLSPMYAHLLGIFGAYELDCS